MQLKGTEIKYFHLLTSPTEPYRSQGISSKRIKRSISVIVRAAKQGGWHVKERVQLLSSESWDQAQGAPLSRQKVGRAYQRRKVYLMVVIVLVDPVDKVGEVTLVESQV